MAAVIRNKAAERFDEIAAPSAKAGVQDVSNKVLEHVYPADLEKEIARRASESAFLYCIIFPVKPPAVGTMDRIKGKFVTVKHVTQEEIDDGRHQILKAINAAGFTTELVYSSTHKEIICKIGATDERLLKEALLKEYKLELDPSSVQYVAELKIKEVEPEITNQPDFRPKNPVYLGYAKYSEAEFEKIQTMGGDEAMPLFLYDEYDLTDPVKSKISLKIARDSFKMQSRKSPFENLHFKYDDEWEQKIVEQHHVQLYRTYNDNTILRTADRITLMQMALGRAVAVIDGTRGAGLDLKKLGFKNKILAYYPIQFSQQTRKAGDISSQDLFYRFQSSACCGLTKMFIPWRQPIQDIRDYCGEKIAYYFAFLEFYSYWLLWSVVIGLAIFIAQNARLSAGVEEGNIITAPIKFVPANFTTFIDDITDPDNFDELDPSLRNTNATSFEDLSIDQVEEYLAFLSEGYTTPRTPFAISVNGDNLLFIVAPTELPIIILVYALGISFWAAFFLEFWKRHQATLAYKWGVSDFERSAEVRPEFKSEFNVPDAVTGLPTPYRSKIVFGVKLGVSLSVVGTAVVMTIAAFTATYIFRVFMATNDFLDPTIATQVALIVNAVAIIILAMVFKTVGKILTDWENHRTDIEYEDSLILKTFVFSFFNSYTTLIYFAFLKRGGELLGRTQFCAAELQAFEFLPNSTENGDDSNFTKEELVNIDSCYGPLGYSLFIIFFSQIVINNAQEIGTPFISTFLKDYFNLLAVRRKLKETAEGGMHAMKDAGDKLVQAAGGDGFHAAGEEKAQDPEFYADKKAGRPLKSPAETQFLLQPYETPFSDYLELALQFGYVTLFVAAFPLAPLLALINNFIEVWVDAKKVCIYSRRPNMSRAQDIGTWQQIFSILSYVAVVTNAGVLVFTSVDLVPFDRTNKENEVWGFLAIILFVFAVKYLTDFVIPDIPDSIKIQLQRQDYLLNKIFYDDEDEHERFLVKREAATGGSGDAQLVADYTKFNILDRDPYLADIITEIRSKLEAKGFNGEKLFSIIDTNNNGYISLKELKNALLKDEMGIDLQEGKQIVVRLFVEALDLDGDGKITKQELIEFMEEDMQAQV